MTGRREFLVGSASLASSVAAGSSSAPAVGSARAPRIAEDVSLCGAWLFRTDAADRGTELSWFATAPAPADWREVRVPHTWQVDPATTEYRGVAWYSRAFDVPERWAGRSVRLEFEAVYHTATVWVNGRLAGEHARKGYTSFTLDIARFLDAGSPNSLTVRVDNSFDEHMLPRGRSSDFPHDGGIFRPVRLLVTPQAFVERVQIEATPDLEHGEASLAIVAHCRNTATKPWRGRASFRVIDMASGCEVLSQVDAGPLAIGPTGTHTVSLTA
jgi:beta-glucuronidase